MTHTLSSQQFTIKSLLTTLLWLGLFFALWSLPIAKWFRAPNPLFFLWQSLHFVLPGIAVGTVFRRARAGAAIGALAYILYDAGYTLIRVL